MLEQDSEKIDEVLQLFDELTEENQRLAIEFMKAIVSQESQIPVSEFSRCSS
ncbi:hypothetical protein SAMN02745130_01042 [Thiothrix eikelboomii]|uniref:Uncharacterized protein n=1 Tax=Thiothrix eikelboomii TaxID=92487 RepID=A0A1T4W5D0_9GAMM|nr:hypothetical protein SAMN02745130_01042 [Thiothrix eikelboomii]